MKIIMRNYGVGMNSQQRQLARTQATDMTRTRGVARVPSPPREIVPQSGPRGVLVTWSLPAGYSDDIAKWRVYKGDENTLYQEIADRGTRQCFVEVTAGSTPPANNIFVSSINLLGQESPKVGVQGTAEVEANAPPMPGVPPGYNQGGSGGGNKGGGYGGGTLRGHNQN